MCQPIPKPFSLRISFALQPWFSDPDPDHPPKLTPPPGNWKPPLFDPDGPGNWWIVIDMGPIGIPIHFGGAGDTDGGGLKIGVGHK